MTFYKFWYTVLKHPIHLLYRVKIYGAENEPDAPYLTCINHTSFADPVLVASALKTPQRFVARSSLFRFRFFNWLFRKIQCIAIHRDRTDVEMVRTCVAALKAGECVAIFPQGTRMHYIKPVPEQAEGGVALLASMTGVPVLPVSIVTKKYQLRVFHRTKIYIDKPVYPEEYENLPSSKKKAIAEHIFSYVCNHFE